ncbi:hypothetical protein SCOR_03240 [Sulfidibacter corallicola]|uniref:WD40/YVTN/BNR-like repeat-containing protein n=1 Tax=Sulfidibacter corallicola TaxID=2818388 RepID=UPI001F3D6060|nr:hypothetical protein [Sulfidibacter corallicola]
MRIFRFSIPCLGLIYPLFSSLLFFTPLEAQDLQCDDSVNANLNATYHDILITDNVHLLGGARQGTPGIWHSPDGVRWAQADAVAAHPISAFAHSGDAFVAIQSQGNQILYSEDGVTWEETNTQTRINGVHFEGFRFVGAAENGRIFHGSLDGGRWNPLIEFVTDEDLLDVTGNEEVLVAVGDNRTILFSIDSFFWTFADVTEDLDPDTAIVSVAWGGNRFLARCEDGTLLTSGDGREWAIESTGQLPDHLGMAWDGSRFWEVDTTGLRRSSNGDTWTHEPVTKPVAFNRVRWQGEALWALGSEGRVYRRENGGKWMRLLPDFDADAVGKVLDDTLYVFADNDMYMTEDGYFWRELNIGNEGAMSDVGRGDTGLVAISREGTLCTSRNGQDWTSRSWGNPDATLESVQYLMGRWWLLDSEGRVMVSNHGTGWVASDLVLSDRPRTLEARDGRLYAFSGDRTYMSEDGIAWQGVPHRGNPGGEVLSNGEVHLSFDGSKLHLSRDGVSWSPGTWIFNQAAATHLTRIGEAFVLTNPFESEASRVSFDGLNWRAMTLDGDDLIAVQRIIQGPDFTMIFDDGGSYRIARCQVAPPTTETPDIVIPWMVANEQWSSRVSFMNPGDEEKTLGLVAVTQTGSRYEKSLRLPPRSVLARQSTDLFGDFTGYSLMVYGAGEEVITSFLTFNLEEISGGSSPSQSTGWPQSKWSESLTFGYLPEEGISSIVLVAPECPYSNTEITMTFQNLDRDQEWQVTRSLARNFPTVLLASDLIPPELQTGAVSVHVRAKNGARLAGTTFIFNDLRQPSMAGAIPTEAGR